MIQEQSLSSGEKGIGEKKTVKNSFRNDFAQILLINREDLKEWMYLDSLENSERGMRYAVLWVLSRKFLGFFPRAHLDHDQAADLIS